MTSRRYSALLRLSVVSLLGLGAQAQAQTTFDVIGPREYELPVDFEPFNVFVQYATFQDNGRAYNDAGERVSGSGSKATTGLSKYVRFWSPASNRNIGVAWEVIVPEVGIRNRGAANLDDRHISGIGDPLTGFAIWYRPRSHITLGFQSFLQIPIGTERVSDTNWKNLSSLFWDWRLGDKFGWTGDAGFVWQGERDSGLQPGLTWHSNHRLAYRASKRLEPFVALDNEHTRAKDGLPKGWALDGGVGLMIHTFDNQSITLRYSTSLDGRNHSVNDSFNLKYAYVW
ncbi:transporter [Steroidobacter sp.]|uniref:transporter n=1 Tax=Steroidobacter sp. TaxID=1978227 RepID=UPI001A4EBF39|nr:transporter [Steroidobacter sp.]MBL8271372.1 transporter [Steroidobacter sp.]